MIYNPRIDQQLLSQAERPHFIIIFLILQFKKEIKYDTDRRRRKGYSPSQRTTAKTHWHCLPKQARPELEEQAQVEFGEEDARVGSHCQPRHCSSHF